MDTSPDAAPQRYWDSKKVRKMSWGLSGEKEERSCGAKISIRAYSPSKCTLNDRKGLELM
jgi:hypothetical protein